MLIESQQGGLVVYRAVSDLAGKGAFFIATILAARRLPAESFGLFSLATTLGWLASVCADFGMQVHLARTVVQQPDRARAALGRWLLVRALTGALSLLTVAAGATLLPIGGTSFAVLTMFTLAYAMSGVSEFLFYYFRALSRSDLESTLVVGQRLGFLGLTIIFLSSGFGVLSLSIAMLVPSAATMALALRLAFTLPITGAADGPHTTGAAGGVGSWGDVIPIGAGILLSALYFRIDVFMLERWAGLEAVGRYNAVFRLVEALRLFPAAVVAVALPRIFSARSRDPLLRLAATLAVAATSIALLIWPLSEWIVVVLYGETFRPTASILRLLVAAFPLMAANYALTHQLIGWHRHRLYAAICGLALATNVGLNVWWIPAAGGIGAACATLATEVVVLAGCVTGLLRSIGAGRASQRAHSGVPA